ncbi:AAA family ATPase [Lactobacillus salivarius]|uniref:AAA family ATPase n=1 Tax=Ligilactobacillus salivarius TaxID=1624 RepID=UPI0013CC334D|nr:ATP-binding protein [Ligilactobacillus salivarius]NGG71785.1 AAA family ATPase [Ligilactobacillus salivarius]
MIKLSFYIKSVRVQGLGVEDAIVKFTKGFNLIEGLSNHGKTMIVQFIEYAFGGRNQKDSLSLNIEGTNYATVKVTLQTEQGEVELARNLVENKSTIKVISQDKRLLSGDYTANSSTDKKLNIGIALLQLIDMPTDLYLPKNEKRDPGHVSFNVLKPLWLLNENDMPKDDSVLLPSSNSGLFLSSLLYLLNGKQIDTYDWREIEKRRIVRDYISGQIEMVEHKKAQLKQKSIGNESKLQEELDNLTMQLDEVSTLVTDKLTKSKKTFNQMSEFNDKIVAADVTLSRYESLKGQYISDIKRLSFIVDGEVAFENIEEPLLCPVCGQPVINVENETKHVEAARKELSRTLALLNDLEQATASLAEKKLSLRKQYAELEKERNAIQIELDDKLYPRLDEIKAAEKDYREQIEVVSQVKVFDALLGKWTSKINDLTNEGIPERDVKFKPKQELGEKFYDDMGEILNSLLEKGNYPKHHVATFGQVSFDIMINGNKKKVSHGKGFRSYLNSVTVMALSEYINKNALYKPEFLIIDTPLEGLSEKYSENPNESMKHGIFELFIERQELPDDCC